MRDLHPRVAGRGVKCSADRDDVTEPPTLYVTVPIEGRLRVESTCRNKAEEARLRDWLRVQPKIRNSSLMP